MSKYQEALVMLAARKKSPSFGRAYQRYGIWYDEQFDHVGNIWYRCAICGEKIVSVFDTTNNIAAIPYAYMKDEAKKHGIRHLRESNLLAFI
jgi:hypothetical protein